MINCPLCTKVLKSPADLNLHVVSHTKEKPHKCHVCSAAFGTIYDLTKHIKSVHDGIKQRKNKNSHCSLCSFKCPSKTLLKIHSRKHSAEQPFSCSLPSCGFKTKYEHSLQQHVRVVHNKERPYECPSEGCTYRAKSIGNLQSHLKSHSDEKPFACPFPGCNHACKFKYQLTVHTCRVHCDEKPFKCSTCDYRGKRKSDLTQHLRTHGNVKRFQCQAPFCGFASHRKGKLKKHLDRKHRKKTVFCTATECNFKCGSITLLKEHLKCHEKPILKCHLDSCPFKTKLRRTLLSHISSRHEGFPANGKEQKHVCTFCLSRFSDFRRLQDHLQRHTGEKPYRCSFCQYATGFTGKLREHAQKTHHINVIWCRSGDEGRKCRTCHVTFWSERELILHSMRHLQPVVVLEQLKLQVL